MNLHDPFREQDIEWRIQQSGLKQNSNEPWAMVLAYVTNRAIQQRLDDVCGPMMWKNEYREGPQGGVICGISIHDIDHGWITKWDGADNTHVEPVKGGLSDSMKRAACQWGIGRYLYDLPTVFAECSIKKVAGWNRAEAKGVRFYWQNPPLPAWATHPDDLTLAKRADLHMLADLARDKDVSVSELCKLASVEKLEDIKRDQLTTLTEGLK